MSTITRELAKLFRKITNSEIDAEGNAHVVLSPADSLLINNARIALASLEAEAVGEVVLGEYDDCGCHPDAKVVCIAADGQADWENFKDGTRLYTAPPAPVSVPAAMEMDDDFDSAFEHGKAVGWNACRAAMLQGADGNSPVIPEGWVACSERVPEESGRYWCYVEEQNDLGKSHYQWNFSWNGDRWWVESENGGRVTHWMPLPAAPQQEVK
ncbi:DUF551 domain-containing protein [Enterobacter hormaechei]